MTVSSATSAQTTPRGGNVSNPGDCCSQANRMTQLFQERAAAVASTDSYAPSVDTFIATAKELGKGNDEFLGSYSRIISCIAQKLNIETNVLNDLFYDDRKEIIIAYRTAYKNAYPDQPSRNLTGCTFLETLKQCEEAELFFNAAQKLGQEESNGLANLAGFLRRLSQSLKDENLEAGFLSEKARMFLFHTYTKTYRACQERDSV